MRCSHILENSKQCVRKSEKGDTCYQHLTKGLFDGKFVEKYKIISDYIQDFKDLENFLTIISSEIDPNKILLARLKEGNVSIPFMFFVDGKAKYFPVFDDARNFIKSTYNYDIYPDFRNYLLRPIEEGSIQGKRRHGWYRPDDEDVNKSYKSTIDYALKIPRGRELQKAKFRPKTEKEWQEDIDEVLETYYSFFNLRLEHFSLNQVLRMIEASYVDRDTYETSVTGIGYIVSRDILLGIIDQKRQDDDFLKFLIRGITKRWNEYDLIGKFFSDPKYRDVVLEEGIYSYASIKRRGSSNEDGKNLIKLLKYLYSLYGKLPLSAFKYKRGKEKNTWAEVMDFVQKNPQMFSSK